MNKKTQDWLLAGPVWLKYAVELQLLGLKPDPKPVLRDPAIARIVARLNDKQVGLPALKAGRVVYTDTGKAYWDLFLLADIGLTIKDIGLDGAVAEVFTLQSPEGAFVIPPNVRDNYFCMSAILLSSIARMGYRDDARIKKYIRLVLTAQGGDGGWNCFDDDVDYADTSSCPMDNLNILMLLGLYEQYRHDPTLDRAIDQLLAHWEGRETDRRLYGFGIGKRFMSLQYPAVKYGILRVLDVLSLFPHAVGRGGFRNMLDFVRQKARDGKYYAGATDGAYADFDFGQQAEPSRWLTFLVNRIEKRVDENR